MLTLIRAGIVMTMGERTWRDGAVLIDGGVIQEVGDAAELARRHPQADHIDLGQSLLMPGLVNAHTHLELSTCTPGEPTEHFIDWVGRTFAQTAGMSDDAFAAAAVQGADECLTAGVTCVGDISLRSAATRRVLAAHPLRVVSFGEVLAMAGRRALLDERLAKATDLTHENPTLRVGVTPHAPYSVEPAGYAACLDWSRRSGRPLTTHLAETPDEAIFLAEHGGAFRTLWDRIGGWDEHVPRVAGGPVRFAKQVGLLDHPALLAHVNYIDDADLDLLAAGRASVVWCPRTHAFFGHRPHRWREMLAKRVNVCIGTDSRASSPDLDLVKELRLVRRQAPDVPAAALWPLVTSHAADALGVWDVGRLRAGARADLVAFESADPDAVLSEKVGVRAVWVDGRPWRPPLRVG